MISYRFLHEDLVSTRLRDHALLPSCLSFCRRQGGFPVESLDHSLLLNPQKIAGVSFIGVKGGKNLTEGKLLPGSDQPSCWGMPRSNPTDRMGASVEVFQRRSALAKSFRGVCVGMQR